MKSARTCACGNFKAAASKSCGDCQGYKITFTPEQLRLIALAEKECFGGLTDL